MKNPDNRDHALPNRFSMSIRRMRSQHRHGADLGFGVAPTSCACGIVMTQAQLATIDMAAGEAIKTSHAALA